MLFRCSWLFVLIEGGLLPLYQCILWVAPNCLLSPLCAECRKLGNLLVQEDLFLFSRVAEQAVVKP